jgi:hypothetical protein
VAARRRNPHLRPALSQAGSRLTLLPVSPVQVRRVNPHWHQHLNPVVCRPVHLALFRVLNLHRVPVALLPRSRLVTPVQHHLQSPALDPQASLQQIPALCPVFLPALCQALGQAVNRPTIHQVNPVHNQALIPLLVQVVYQLMCRAATHLQSQQELQVLSHRANHLVCPVHSPARSPALNPAAHRLRSPVVSPVVNRHRTRLSCIPLAWKYLVGERTRPLWRGRWTVWGTRTTTPRCT